MHRTISGETLNAKTFVDIKEKKFLNDFLLEDKQKYKSIINHENCLYNGKIISSPVLSYINESNTNDGHKKIKNLIINEYDICEKIYPYLGELFVKYYHEGFDKKTYKGQRFNKKNIKRLISDLKFSANKSIAKLIFEKFSIEYFVSIKNTKGNSIIVEKDNQNIFFTEYDFDYFLNSKNTFSNYRYLIVDGVIDTVGEIHHLLHKSSEDKEMYIVFCRGCHPEVKNTILKNNALGNTNIYLVCFDINEANINILNDISLLHDSADIISSQKGQTISQEIRKKFKIGKKIQFEKNGIKLTPMCSKEKLTSHRNFIQKRIDKSSNEKNKEVLLQRYRNLQDKKLNIYVPELEKNNLEFYKELNYVLSVISNTKESFCKISHFNKTIFIPVKFIDVLKNKLNSFKKTINNIEYLLFNLERQ